MHVAELQFAGTGLNEYARRLKRVRIWLALFMLGLIASGLTAFPLQREVTQLFRFVQWAGYGDAALGLWVGRVQAGLTTTYTHYPFVAYGTDWLAFAHLVIAIAFVGPWLDPVKNKWVLQFGVIACSGVIPLAMIAGAVRGIPVFWRAIDCSFGLAGVIPLVFCLRLVREMES